MPTQATTTLLPPETGAAPVRLRTLMNMRWLAVTGQSATLAIATFALSLSLPLLACVLIVLLMVAANLAAQLLYSPTHRLSEREASLFLLFDLVQLSALLFLTGGLNNPFAILIVGPVTLAATTLSRRATILIGAVALVLISLLGGYHMPLTSESGDVLDLPRLHLIGFWFAIVITTLLLGAFSLRLTLETERMSNALLATQTALSREQKLHDISGMVAAAAHELGTPLATIKLVSAELEEEIEDPDQRADAALIRSQADRCRDILRAMGEAGRDADPQMKAAPLQTIVSEAAEPHTDRGIDILYDFAAESGTSPRRPRILRAPEIIHSLRNLVQNAVDHAEATVWIEGRWDENAVRLRIEDDGPGYPAEILSRLGDPFLKSVQSNRQKDGMGLGLFISKTLLARTGARVRFANRGADGPGTRGALAEIEWPRDRIEFVEHGGQN
ncbi:sensor histidine kinase RegB [Jannaschia aquimarina]|uniref:histidine kinase n=1 Tax=Jannaschia aquimarina TaxID=935700 RepID=A0A0D1CKY7_9RHOB|nr:ActS/PrrB/RegB family redox-sensitive histidine kinase [Jannaschia aquimarina]KIT15447.1 Sensor histidine kinase RegB [Jannaschia aquimarina]SNT22243.1 two-component system, sensor histidine kinase RegB [Jannaschia aquimarina]